MRRAVYAGSFDELIVAIGVNPEKRYLFALDERLAMLREVTTHCRNIVVDDFSNLFLVHYAQQVGADFILRGIRNEQDYQFERGMRYVNAEMGDGIKTIFLIPPRELVEVSSSFVKGLVGPKNWENIVQKFVPEPVYRAFLRKFAAGAERTP